MSLSVLRGERFLVSLLPIYNAAGMQTVGIAELLLPFLGQSREAIADSMLSGISTYIDILLRWNARINLTAIRDPEEIVTRHFGESFFAAKHLFPSSNKAQGREAAHNVATSAPATMADVGSGAGFPGIPIKLWAPQVALTLIESNHKKATFLREIARALILTDINIQTARAETLPAASFDLVTLRAVERFEKILPAAAALLKPHGRLALLISANQVAQAQAILPHHNFHRPLPIPLSQSRVLSVSQPPKVLSNQVHKRVGQTAR